MSPRNIFLAVIAFFALFTALDVFYIVNQQQQALVLQFREAKRIVKEPGLYTKLPYIQDVVFFDKRILSIEPPAQQAILAEQKRLIVDAFARYRITDPLRFFQRLNNERRAADQIGILVNSSLRQVLGTVSMQEVLSADRAKIMNNIRDEVNNKVAVQEGYGVEIIDVRIRKADLPTETSQAIFARMRSERQQEAAQFRAKGQEQAQEIKSKAERERTALLAEATREAEITRGKGDREALRLVARASGKDPSFYSFYRALQAYRVTLANEDTAMVLSPDGSGFFRYFSQPKAR